MLDKDKIHIDVALVHRLISTQFPQWADLEVKPLKVGGWDNRTFHLGNQMTVRDAFRAALPLDDDTWARGRGWALWKALIVYAGLPGTNPLEVENSKRVLEEVLADYKCEVFLEKL